MAKKIGNHRKSGKRNRGKANQIGKSHKCLGGGILLTMCLIEWCIRIIRCWVKADFHNPYLASHPAAPYPKYYWNCQQLPCRPVVFWARASGIREHKNKMEASGATEAAVEEAVERHVLALSGLGPTRDLLKSPHVAVRPLMLPNKA
jgi:hypothetical protein